MADGQRFRPNQHRIRPKHQRHADMFEQHAMLWPNIQIGARQSKPLERKEFWGNWMVKELDEIVARDQMQAPGRRGRVYARDPARTDPQSE